MAAVHYGGQRGGNCCRWPGAVRLRADEPAKIAAFLGLAEDEFVARHTDLMPDRRSLTLQSRPDGSCIFLEGVNHCAIQAAKPFQCAGFPNAWNFPGWREVCEAIPVPIPAAS